MLTHCVFPSEAGKGDGKVGAKGKGQGTAASASASTGRCPACIFF